MAATRIAKGRPPRRARPRSSVWKFPHGLLPGSLRKRADLIGMPVATLLPYWCRNKRAATRQFVVSERQSEFHLRQHSVALVLGGRAASTSCPLHLGVSI